VLAKKTLFLQKLSNLQYNLFLHSWSRSFPSMIATQAAPMNSAGEEPPSYDTGPAFAFDKPSSAKKLAREEQCIVHGIEQPHAQ
jgi:hypothetical protein